MLDPNECPDNDGKCEACGRRIEVTIATIDTTAGPFCLARCPQCSVDDELPPGWNASAVADRMRRHRIHAMRADLARNPEGCCTVGSGNPRVTANVIGGPGEDNHALP